VIATNEAFRLARGTLHRQSLYITHELHTHQREDSGQEEAGEEQRGAFRSFPSSFLCAGIGQGGAGEYVSFGRNSRHDRIRPF